MNMTVLTILAWSLTAIFVVAQQLLLLDDMKIMTISPKLRKVCLVSVYLIGIVEALNSRLNWF